MDPSTAENFATRLEGSLVVLEPLCESHREGLWRAAQPREIWRWTTHIADTRADFDAWVAARMSEAESGEKYTFTTIDCASEEPIGSSTFHHYRPQDGVIEIGSTWLNPSFWRSGANAETKLLMMGHAFEDLRCVRVEFKTDARNERSRAALAALPAQFEGVLRKQIKIPGVGVRDSAFYSVIDDEWPAVRANLEARLERQHKAP
ncbi:MAG TPA: GNAT family protein [Solirubrobacterales bacterium]|nr:GNAT family protein [Solirubrobacterales bacterium]